MDTISVMMCAYNAENTIEKAIRSVLENRTADQCRGGQMFDIQLIVLNDGSNDDTESIVKKLCDEDKRIVYVYQENKGISCARENALRYMTGQYFAFCDSDDWVEPDWLLSMYMVAKKYDADFVRFRSLIENSGAKYNPDDVLVWNNKEAIREFFIHKKLNAMLLMNLIKRSVFEGTHFDESLRYWEDQSVALKLLSKAKRIVRVNDAKYHYYINHDGMSNGITNPKKIQDSLTVMNAHVSFCEHREWIEFLESAKSFRRRWMLGELKSMYKSDFYLPEIEKEILKLYRECPGLSLSESKGKDRLFLISVLCCPYISRMMVKIIM